MLTLYFLIIPLFYFPIKLILYIITTKYGKFSYNGISAFGFAYDKDSDIFYSTKDAWQKNFGYSHLYDVASPLFRIILDTESVKFYYNNKNWLITFWKGQYGIVTGAEIGVYYTNQKYITKKTLYFPAEKDMLDMEFTLFYKGFKIASIKDLHWWLALFKIGMFSKPKDLTMDIKITFKDEDMLNAFLTAFKKLKYKEKDYTVINNTLSFTYIKPHTHKVWTRIWLFDLIRQFWNKQNVKLYDKYLSDAIATNNKENEKLILLDKFIPDILKNNSNTSSKKANVIFINNNVYSKLKNDNHD
jgi:hypothetical protein